MYNFKRFNFFFIFLYIYIFIQETDTKGIKNSDWTENMLIINLFIFQINLEECEFLIGALYETNEEHWCLMVI